MSINETFNNQCLSEYTSSSLSKGFLLKDYNLSPINIESVPISEKTIIISEIHMISSVLSSIKYFVLPILLILTISSLVILFNYKDIINYLNGISFKYRRFIIKVSIFFKYTEKIFDTLIHCLNSIILCIKSSDYRHSNYIYFKNYVNKTQTDYIEYFINHLRILFKQDRKIAYIWNKLSQDTYSFFLL